MMNDRAGSNGNTLARIASILLHPLLLPIYMLAVLLLAPTVIAYMPVRMKLVLMAVVVVNTIVLPLLLIILLWYRKHLSSLAMENREERTIVLLMTALLYLVTAVMIWRLNLPGIIKSFIAAVTLLLFLLTIINLKYKISIHAAGAGAMSAIMVLLSVRLQVPLLPFVISAFALSGISIIIISSMALHQSMLPTEGDK